MAIKIFGILIALFTITFTILSLQDPYSLNLQTNALNFKNIEAKNLKAYESNTSIIKAYYKANSWEFRIEKPYLLSIFLEDRQGKILEKLAFNDVVISKKNQASMAHIEVFRKEKKFNEYFGDGLIVATPAGSTAYNLSANGPIVYTLAQAFILTPVCSHSLTQRPIVLPKGFEIEIMAKDCMLCIDGQENYKMNDFKSIKVGLSDKNVALIHPKNRDYFQILKEKLHWGN